MFTHYKPTGLVHAVLLALFLAPMFYLYRLHSWAMGLDRIVLTTTWIIAFFLGGGVLYGITFLWRLTGELVLAALRMRTPLQYELEILNPA